MMKGLFMRLPDLLRWMKHWLGPGEGASLPKGTGMGLLVDSLPDSAEAEMFKALKAKLLFSGRGSRPRTIMVTSAYPGEGKTFVTSNLAASIAVGIDEHVLLVDCDLRQPSLHRTLGCGETEGLHEYLMGTKGLPELILRTRIPKLSLLPAGRVPVNPTELLSSARMSALIEELKGRYEDRYILIDSTPSQVTAEAGIIAGHVDGVILVVLAQKTARKAVQKTIENLGKEKVLGVVFNGYTQANKEYRAYYNHYYRTK